MTDTPNASVDARIVAFAAKVAEALLPVKAASLPYGEVYVEQVTFGFEGEPVNVAVVVNEHGDFDVTITP